MCCTKGPFGSGKHGLFLQVRMGSISPWRVQQFRRSVGTRLLMEACAPELFSAEAWFNSWRDWNRHSGRRFGRERGEQPMISPISAPVRPAAPTSGGGVDRASGGVSPDDSSMRRVRGGKGAAKWCVAHGSEHGWKAHWVCRSFHAGAPFPWTSVLHAPYRE
jgi:hypothetical protein